MPLLLGPPVPRQITLFSLSSQIGISEVVENDLLTQSKRLPFSLRQSRLYLLTMAVQLIRDAVKGIVGKVPVVRANQFAQGTYFTTPDSGLSFARRVQ